MTCTHQIVEVYLWTVLGGFLRFDHETINEMDHDDYFREIGLQCLLVLWFLPFENEVLRVSLKKSACFQMAGVHQ